MLPTIAVTLGDPAGVGPEIIVKALADPAIAGLARWIVCGEAPLLEAAAAQAGVAVPGAPQAEIRSLGAVAASDVVPGRIDAACGRAAIAYIREATRLCLDGRAGAMVTAPVSKESVTLSGMHFTGHTEFIAELCGARDSRMLLANERMRVVHVSTHVSLRKACDLDRERVLRTIELAYEAALWLGFPQPRIAVCGLNPHAGESGLFGDEDARAIRPAIEAAREVGINAEGPVPGDTVFLKASRGAFDMVVAMYHDQGHIPMKLLDFEHTVNISLGLPILRTSVDHGTAFDIAGKNLADPTNMKAAMRLAAVMAAHRATA